MANGTFPDDKERGGLMEAHMPAPPVKEEVEEESQPTTSQTLFLLITMWLSWWAHLFFDLLLQIDEKKWWPSTLSPLEHFFYKRNWDLWIHDHDYGLLTHKNTSEACLGTMTLAILLFWGLKRTLPTVDPIVMSIAQGTIALTPPLATLAGVSGREIGLIIVPFVALIGMTAWVLMLRAGFGNLRRTLGISEQTASWCESVSLYCIVASCAWQYGPFHDFVVMFVVMNVVNHIYKRLG